MGACCGATVLLHGDTLKDPYRETIGVTATVHTCCLWCPNVCDIGPFGYRIASVANLPGRPVQPTGARIRNVWYGNIGICFAVWIEDIYRPMLGQSSRLARQSVHKG